MPRCVNMGFKIMIGIVIAVIVYVIVLFNQLVQAKNIVKNSSAQIDTQLKRRFDLIPNLVECVKQYMSYEKETLTKVVELRSSINENTAIEQKSEALRKVNSSLKQILVSVEAYPDLKANTNFIQLQSELKVTEDKIAFARQFYNDSVTRYNNKVLVFPNNILAKIFGFVEEKYFEIDEDERENVVVKMD